MNQAMTFRIDRIHVNRGGPLESDFEFVPGDLNLVYGRNETGKTYVVESLIRFLFKTTGKAPVAAGLRDWSIGGRVIVSGLEDSEPFKNSSKKLEDYWENGAGLPSDLSRLLVVRAGETLLAESAEDGVGRDMLKDYLSGEGLLERVAGGISLTLQKAEVEFPQIKGSRAGELKARETSIAHLDELQDLLEQVEQGYASGDISTLRQQRDALEAQVDVLQQARRYQAGQLAGHIEDLNRQERALPRESDLARIESNVRTVESNQTTIDSESEKLRELEGTSADFEWAKEAVGVYRDAVSGTAGSGQNPVFLLLTLLSVLGTVAFGLLGLRSGLIGSAVLAVGFAVAYHMGSKKALSTASRSAELSKLKDAYRARFGSELTDGATLQTKFEELNKSQILAAPLRESIDTLSDETGALEREITATLKTWTGIEVPIQEWRDVIQKLVKRLADIEKETVSLKRSLSPLLVPENEYLAEDPGETWDPECYQKLKQELQRGNEALRAEEGDLEDLRIRVSQETGLGNADWEDLITALRDKRENAACEYKQLTAEILAKIQVYAVVEELRKQENSRIAEGLKRPELTEPLYALTGRYQSIRLDEEKGLVLVSDTDEDYPLADMSTGVREQVFLALRMGFASIAMEGQTGFLILDDAFQHSDWNRRQNLVDHTLNFIQSGWQVFYFTMDDHIRNLFKDAGASLGDRFEECELG